MKLVVRNCATNFTREEFLRHHLKAWASKTKALISSVIDTWSTIFVSFCFRIVSLLINHQRQSKVSFRLGGQSPMHLACQKGYCEVVNEIASLVPEWIDATCSNQDMCTPLHIAWEYSHKDVISVLLEHGAIISTTEKDELSPLHIAVRKDFTEGVKLLLEKRPECANLRDKQQRTSLHYAGEHCHKAEIIALLLER